MKVERPLVDVVAGVLLRGSQVLLASRPAGKVYAGWWEFPGGKVEAGESQEAALARELHEELGITVHASYPWLTRVFDYEHARVRVHFRRIYAMSGTIQCREGQEVVWERIGQWQSSPLLPANAPILKALELPPVYAISQVAELGEAAFLARLETQLQAGLRLLQLREKDWPLDDQMRLGQAVVARAKAHGARVLVNSDMPLSPDSIGADGIHLSGNALWQTSERPTGELVAASCHTAEDLVRAAQLALDFVTLSPVLPTQSHPGMAALQWSQFAQLCSNTEVPVFALGGLTVTDLDTAIHHGGHGLALLRAAWR